MRVILLISGLMFALSATALAETASEIPLANPEILKPDSRPKGNIKPNADQEAKNEKDSPQVQPDFMTLKKLAEIVRVLDPDATVGLNRMRMMIEGVPVLIVADPLANRMRAFTPIKSLDGVNQRDLYRLLQANFDSALDARYAIANGHVLSVFIHPLAELKKNQFIEGLGQVINLVKTYGTAYTSGAIVYGNGDSRKLHRKLIDDLLKKGEEI